MVFDFDELMCHLSGLCLLRSSLAEGGEYSEKGEHQSKVVLMNTFAAGMRAGKLLDCFCFVFCLRRHYSTFSPLSFGSV